MTPWYLNDYPHLLTTTRNRTQTGLKAGENLRNRHSQDCVIAPGKPKVGVQLSPVVSITIARGSNGREDIATRSMVRSIGNCGGHYMNSRISQNTSPFEIVHSVISNRGLIYNLTKREIIGRYRGSVIGLFWSFVNPILMLAVYTFVFSIVFKARWAGGGESRTEFALVLFAGLLVFNLFSECINRAPSLIISNTNYVKKVIFPLEILPIVVLGSAAFHFMIGFTVWLVFFLIFFGLPPLTIIWLPLILLPLILMTLGLSWLLASLGVYLRDINQIIGVVTTMLLFLSPIFYPVIALPEDYRVFMRTSPLTFSIEQARDVMIWDRSIAWESWIRFLVASLAVSWFGFTWFQKTRRGFSDVL